ncbi:MAG: group 1 truncated hemoglobin [Bacteroidetes bacterium]|nr:group 1 truncated hemoglobin [Bacteroidota bacterium]
MKKTTTKTGIITALLLAVIVLAFTPTMQSCKKNNTTAATQTLYDSLGGTTMVNDPANPGTMIEKGRLGIRSVVDSTIFVIAADTAINGFFTVLLTEVTSGNTSGLTALSKNLTDFFCVATGAQHYTYGGKSMTAAHDPAQNSRMNGKADSHDFDVFVNDLVTGATKCGLSSQLIGQVGRVVNTTRSQVVQQ